MESLKNKSRLIFKNKKNKIKNINISHKPINEKEIYITELEEIIDNILIDLKEYKEISDIYEIK